MTLVAIDTETGGFDASKCAMLSIALVELDKNINPIRELEIFIEPYPGKIIEDQAMKVNGFTYKKWAERGATTLIQAMERIRMWMPNNPEPLAHNAGFDKSFIDQSEKLTGISLYMGYAWECSMALFHAVSRAYGLNYLRMNLDSAAKATGHWKDDYVRGDHSALDDAKACAAIYKWCINRMKDGILGQRDLPIELL